MPWNDKFMELLFTIFEAIAGYLTGQLIEKK